MRRVLLFCLFLGVASAATRCNLFHFAIENELDCGPVAPDTWKTTGSVAMCSCKWRCLQNLASDFICNDDGHWYTRDARRFDCLSCGAVDCSIPIDVYHDCKQRDRGSAVSGATRGQSLFCKCRANKRFYGLTCQADGKWSFNKRLPPCPF
ncbi:Hypothetical predicted protein [Cloeon dipterum]|uniref:Sushi domain-containing protein n=1 Tax=Cloeon dipterum TaxID=197152 RepID=A0A8S1DS80_9INSE|nr:Hypothetical predicted protein [Cloeon dipterum]